MAKTADPTVAPAAQDRAQAPIRWPRPDAAGVVLVLLWIAGVVLALFVPALIVSPGQEVAPTEDVLWALGCTVVGTLVMTVASMVLYRRTGEVGVVVLGAVPAFSCLAGGIVLAATKLTGTGTGVG